MSQPVAFADAQSERGEGSMRRSQRRAPREQSRGVGSAQETPGPNRTRALCDGYRHAAAKCRRRHAGLLFPPGAERNEGGSRTRRFGFILFLIAIGALGGRFAANVAGGAPEHSDPCHSQHTCPSDHHTYVWTDTSTGLAWDCAEPGAPEYDPSRDTTAMVYLGLTYYCRSETATTTSTLATTIATTVTESTSTSATSAITSTTSSTATTTLTTPGPRLPSIILPDPKITPGALNPKVRQSTIKKTICKSGWTKAIQPPVSYTNALKIQQMVLYEETGSPSEYEEDHFIPLELGGAPKNPKNLWPEPLSQSKLSDPLEAQLKRKVCNGAMKLKKARATIRLFKNTQG